LDYCFLFLLLYFGDTVVSLSHTTVNEQKDEFISY